MYCRTLDEHISHSRLPNGLAVTVVPRKGFTKKLAYFVTDFGSMHTRFRLDGQEHQVPDGIAHYLEHKLFDMPGERDVSAEFAAMGAVTNAFTSYDMTAYYFSCTQHFEECLKLLLEFVSTPWFTAGSVERERGIIDQEIGMNADAPDSMVFENLVRAMYAQHPVRVPVLGTGESIRAITPEHLNLCHRAFYTPENMLLCVIGDVDPAQVEQLARQVLGDERRPAGEKLCHWREPVTSPQPSISAVMEVAMPTFDLAFKAEPLGKGDAAIRQELVADLAAEVLFGESSRLYAELYAQGLIDSSFGGGFETIDGCAMFLISGDSDQPEQVKDALIREAKAILASGIPEPDFLRMKRSALGRRIRGLDSFDGTCFRICAYHFSDFDYFRFPEVYEQITTGDILEFLGRLVQPERSCLSIIYPKENCQ